VRTRVIAPAQDLRQLADTVNLRGCNLPGDNHFVSFRICRVHDEMDCLVRREWPMVFTVVTDEHRFVVGDAEVNTHDHALTAALQFPEPLV